MKEIKFRAWDRQLKNMSFYTLDTMTVGNTNYLGSGCFFDIEGTKTDPTEKEFMLYTGLKDKSEKEIYEGDIVQYFDTLFSPRELYIIDFVNGMFYLKSNEDEEYNADLCEVAPLEVIGNIYENPELLK